MSIHNNLLNYIIMCTKLIKIKKFYHTYFRNIIKYKIEEILVVATCGDWRQGWTALLETIDSYRSELVSIL